MDAPLRLVKSPLLAGTNTVVSGLLWAGPPQELINAARAKRVTLYSSVTLIAEFAEVIGREKFATRMRSAGVSAPGVVADYAQLVRIVVPADIRPTVTGDPDDDHVLACALAAEADLIVSRDKRLRNLKSYHSIPIVTAAEAVKRLPQGV